MNTRICILLLGSLAALAGCGPNPYVASQIDELHRVRRDLEDMVYELQYENQAYAQELEACRQQLQQSGDGSGTPRGPRIGAPPLGDEGPGILPPSVDYGQPVAPDGDPREMRRVQPDELEEDLSLPDELPSPRGASRQLMGDNVVEPEPTDTRVTHIVLIPDRTHGRNFDGRLGDDGVTVVVEPRNADDQFVPRPGPISVVVLDPALEGEAARVARWDFDGEEIGYRLRKGSRATRGIDLKLPWPDQPPATGELHVFVRYETDDGRKLEIDGPLVVTLPGRVSQRWTPRPAGSGTPRPAASVARRDGGTSASGASTATIAPVSAAPIGTGVIQRGGDETASSGGAIAPRGSAIAPRELPQTSDAIPPISGSAAGSSAAPRRPVWQPYR